MIRPLAFALLLAPSVLAGPPEEPFEAVRRPGSVDLDATYNLADLQIPRDEIHTLLPRDAIPALTDPTLEPASEATWLEADDRVIVIEAGGEAVAAPIRILNFHEVANMTIAGEPIAATFCPLCDSASVISRRIHGPNGRERVLEFGVSGALYNSNVLLYDRSDMALWSQLGMEAVSGPLAGARLGHLPARVIPWGGFLLEYPGGRVISRDTGHARNYDNANPYARFLSDPDHLLVPIRGVGDALPMKTLGVGVRAGDDAWFVPESAIGDGGFTLETDAGDVRIERTGAGISVASAPASVQTAQTFYYSWSAFYPDATVIEADGAVAPRR